MTELSRNSGFWRTTINVIMTYLDGMLCCVGSNSSSLSKVFIGRWIHANKEISDSGGDWFDESWLENETRAHFVL